MVDRTSGRSAPAATFKVVERGPNRMVWHGVEIPADWVDARIVFALETTSAGGTTLLFRHEGWRQESEFMNGWSTTGRPTS